jgi:hypothetical protein
MLPSVAQLLNMFLPACTYIFRSIFEIKILYNKHFMCAVKNGVLAYICTFGAE